MLPHLKERLSSGIDFGRLFASKLIAFMGNDELGGYTYRFTRTELFVKLCMVICNVFYYGCMLLAIRGIFGAPAQLAAERVPAAAAVYAGAHAGTYAGRGLKPVPLLDNSVIIILAAFALGGSETSRRSA